MKKWAYLGILEPWSEISPVGGLGTVFGTSAVLGSMNKSPTLHRTEVPRQAVAKKTLSGIRRNTFIFLRCFK